MPFMNVPIPDLNAFGLLPAGNHDCTCAEVAAAYAGNDARQLLWNKFEAFIAWVEQQPKPITVLLDGSFTGDKPNPADIDVVVDLSDADAAFSEHWLRVFFTQRAWIKQEFSVDFWVYAPGFPNDLRSFFQYVRPDEALTRGMGVGETKGLLRVTI